MQYSLDALIFLEKMHLKIVRVNVNDLKGHYLLASQVIPSKPGQ